MRMTTFSISSNPFFEDDASQDVIMELSRPDTQELSAVDDDEGGARAVGLSLDSLASKLLNERLYLTALELHIELMESGRELVKLRDFFSNPANFERTGAQRPGGAVIGESSPPRLTRTASIQTFDSLDFARSSDDGERNENDRIAVLEFELRKTHETIRSLRAALTRSAASEIPNDMEPVTATPSKKIPSIDEPARPHERRALNFLVNEYLLRHDYKLTSVTFSEENANQDFDDWDDVGINVSKPPGLVYIYRDYGQPRGLNQNVVLETCDFSCTVDSSCFDTIEISQVELELQCRIAVLDNHIKVLEAENRKLALTIHQLETSSEPINNDVVHHLSQSTPIASPIGASRRNSQLCELNKLDITDGSEPIGNSMDATTQDSVDQTIDAMYRTALDESLQDCPMIVAEKGSHNGSGETEAEIQSSTLSSSGTLQQESRQLCDNSNIGGRKTPAVFRQALLKAVFNVLTDNRIYAEVSHIAEQNESASSEVIPLLARCLPHVVPNVLLAGRDELIPLIVCAAALHSDSKTRDHLLNILFNLIKRPDIDQRRMILLGCVAFARHAGVARVESELLPQCWEQITHKYVERRLLVAEACCALTPHIPPELRSSLIFSMLHQMLEDSSEEVREAAVRSFGVLVGFVQDGDKYSQVESVFFAALNDPSERVTVAVHQVFLPSLAVWSMELGRLETGLMSSFVGRIQKLISGSHSSVTVLNTTSAAGVVISDPHQFCLLVNTLCQLMPVLLASILSCAPFANEPYGDEVAGNVENPISMLLSLPKPASDLLDAGFVLGGEDILAKLVRRYEAYINEEWYHPWQAYSWVAHELISQIKSFAEVLSSSDQTIVHALSVFFRNMCHTFGGKFSKTVVRPVFQKTIKLPTADTVEMSLLEHASLVRCISPVYIVGVLSAFALDEDRLELARFLCDFIQTVAIRECNLVGVYATIAELCSIAEQSTGLPDVVLSVLWDCVVHPSPLIRAAAAKSFQPAVRAGGIAESLVGTRIVPALVTLAGDIEPEVRASTVGALGAVVECVTGRSILDKVYMQFQSLMDDPAYRDEIALTTALIRALGHAGPAAEPRFRDDFILPRLTALAVQNSTSVVDMNVRRTEVAMALFDAYSSVSCCFFGDQLVGEVLLPGLRCLHRDLQQLAPDHAGIVASMIREFEDRTPDLNTAPMTRSVDTSATNGNMTSPSVAGSDAIKSKMLSHIKDVKDRASHSNLNLSKMFATTKK